MSLSDLAIMRDSKSIIEERRASRDQPTLTLDIKIVTPTRCSASNEEIDLLQVDRAYHETYDQVSHWWKTA